MANPESATKKQVEEEKTESVPDGDKDVFDALLKSAVPPLEEPQEEETYDPAQSGCYVGSQTLQGTQAYAFPIREYGC